MTHELADAVACDRILFLEGGRIVERGSHAELIAAGGRYAALFAAQSAETARGHAVGA